MAFDKAYFDGIKPAAVRGKFYRKTEIDSLLSEIAASRQIISVTHLPQIAAYGDDNYLISKSIDNDKSYTSIDHLDDASKVKMIATLFSGSSDSENALEAARELIDSARK